MTMKRLAFLIAAVPAMTSPSQLVLAQEER